MENKMMPLTLINLRNALDEIIKERPEMANKPIFIEASPLKDDSFIHQGVRKVPAIGCGEGIDWDSGEFIIWTQQQLKY